MFLDNLPPNDSLIKKQIESKMIISKEIYVCKTL